MIKKEKQIYKSGRKNPDGYSLISFMSFKKKIIFIIFVFSVIFSLIISFLHITDIFSWNKLLSTTGFIEGVKRQDSNFVIYYLDVGQSDCTIIVCDDEVLVIDAGTVNQVHNIKESLFSLEIEEIDYLLVTHQHDDHMAGASKLIEKYDVNNIIMPRLSKINSVDTLTYQDLINNISNRCVNPIEVSAGDSFMLGSATVQILSPQKQDDNLNNMSIVLKVTYGETSFLFQGDSEDDVEKQLLRSGYDLSANILKVGHHGSNTSSTNSFLETVNPDYAIISCGYDNNYGHPNSFVIERLEGNNITPYITSINGNITAISNGKSITIITEKNN